MVQWRCIIGGGVFVYEEYAVPLLHIDPEDEGEGSSYAQYENTGYRKEAVTSQEDLHGVYRIPTPYGSKLLNPRDYRYESLPGFIEGLNPGMGICNIRKYKNDIYDMDFWGYLRMPLELGAYVVRIGVFVKRMPNGNQYLSLKCIDRETVDEGSLNKRTRELLLELFDNDKIKSIPGINSFEPLIEVKDIEINIDGFDEVNNEW
jgi:hypothetical protein